MINPDKNLILVKGEDKTSSIVSWKYDRYKPVVYITYRNGRSYPYNKHDVQFYKNPRTEMVGNAIVQKNGNVINGVEILQYFSKYCRIVYASGHRELVISSNVQVVHSALETEKSRNCFEYLKQIAVNIGLSVKGENILAKRYEKIDFVREDSVFAAFLSGSYKGKPDTKKSSIIYPFGFNLSQKTAVDNALYNQLSIIEGPPGTGKTQTILNIIANVVMRGESVAVVASNNSATTNVMDKLQRYGVEFIVAPLGSADNKETFIQNQNLKLPDMSRWKPDEEKMAAIRKEESELDRMLACKNELSITKTERAAVEKEKMHFADYSKSYDFTKDLPHFAKRISSEKILRFVAEYDFLVSQDRLRFFQKIKLKLSYGIKNFRFYGKGKEIIEPYCQKIYYERKIRELDKKRSELESELSNYDFDAKMKQYAQLSMMKFKAYLAKRYGGTDNRKQYIDEDLWRNSDEFIKDYPVILSTTYSVRSSLSGKFIYDYVIVDEASQVDLVTGALALSCAKKAVIVGDLMQLPNVVNQECASVTNSIFELYKLNEAYRYADHSLLSSITSLFPRVPRVLLREHYRCHPEIIGFCNQRFYNNELIILTEQKKNDRPLMVYRTVAGNHARDHVNQRQIDVIVDEIFRDLKLSKEDESVGIVTPYRNQADELKKVFSNTGVKADTADKFQGQERSVMIFSTVDNEIGEFASNPNRLNVAVSRAIDQFIVVTDGNDSDSTSPIHELIGYIQYHNHEIINSEIRSVFDCLYKAYDDVRKQTLKKYGRISDVDSENLMYSVIRDVLACREFAKYDVVAHVPLRMILSDFCRLDTRELMFASNHLTHVDFLIYSKVTHLPVLVVEVDGFSYHKTDKQQERDGVKNSILKKYNIPIVRFNTVGSGEKNRLIAALSAI